MELNPFEREDTHQTNISKNKQYNNQLTPLTIRQINSLAASNKMPNTKIVLIARIVSIKEMIGRTQLKVTD